MSEKNINDAVDLVVNSIVSRRKNFVSSITGSANTKQSKCWQDYGYPVNPDFDDYYAMYMRGGYAKAGIEVIPDKCWKTKPRIASDNQAFADVANELAKSIGLWHNLKMLDIYQRVGHYAGAIIYVADGKDLSEPVEGKITPDAIVGITPYYEGQLTTSGSEFYTDKQSPKYGLPKTYELKERDVGVHDANRGLNEPRIIHESRVLIWSEGATGNNIVGIPTLKAGLNALINIEKILGAGGEGFWKNARTPMALSTESGMDIAQLAESYGVSVKELSDKINDKLKKFYTNLDSAWLTGGMNITPITASLPNPQSFLEGNKLEFAASVKVPLTILEGNQSGNQASQENGDTLDEMCESRRENEITPIIKAFFNRLIEWGVFKDEEFSVEWDSLLEPSPSEKLNAAMLMAQMNQMALGTGVVYFTPEQIQERAGYEVDDGE